MSDPMRAENAEWSVPEGSPARDVEQRIIQRAHELIGALAPADDFEAWIAGRIVDAVLTYDDTTAQVNDMQARLAAARTEEEFKSARSRMRTDAPRLMKIAQFTQRNVLTWLQLHFQIQDMRRGVARPFAGLQDGNR